MKVHLVRTVQDLNDFIVWMGRTHPILSIDTETSGLRWWDDSLRMVQIGNTTEAWCFPMPEWLGPMRDILSHHHELTALHNHMFDDQFLSASRLHLTTNRDCTRTLAHIQNPNRSLSLKPLTAKMVPEASAAQQELQDAMSSHGWDWGSVPAAFPAYWEYAGMDTIATSRLWEYLQPYKRYPVYQLEMASQLVMVDMVRHGLKIDRPYAECQALKLRDFVRKTDQWCRDTYGVDVRSRKNLLDILTTDGWEPLRTPTNQPSLSTDSLATCDHPLAKVVLRMRKSEKQVSTWYDALLDAADQDDLIHPNIRPVGALTGRMSITDPPLQTLPRSKAVRSMVVARENHRLVSVDYDGIELRIAADLSGDGNLRDAFAAGDPHTETAKKIYLTTQPTKEQRTTAKNVSYAVLFGGGATRIQDMTGLSYSDAMALMDGFWKAYPKMKLYRERMTSTTVPVMTKDGRPVHPANPSYRMLNHNIQSTAADVLKAGMVRIGNTDYRDAMRLAIHDELLNEVPTQQATEALKDLQDLMLDERFDPPLTASGVIIKTWGDQYE